jgi:hypothetical protein
LIEIPDFHTDKKLGDSKRWNQFNNTLFTQEQKLTQEALIAANICGIDPSEI